MRKRNERMGNKRKAERKITYENGRKKKDLKKNK
jgi:hypothetical protein